MFRCHVCGSAEAKDVYVNEIFQIANKPVMVEHIPATVCLRCGEESFSRETTEHVRRMIHGESEPIKSVCMDVFVFRPEAMEASLHI